MLDKLKLFYGKLFYYSFKRISKRDSNPEIMIIGFISFCQSNNLLTIVNLLIMFTEINIRLKFIYIGLHFFMFGINFYHYDYKGFSKKILNKENIYYQKNMGIISFAYFLLSVFLFFKTIPKFI